MLKLDFIQTVAAAGAVLFIGYALRRLIRPLARYNIPAPVVGGLLVAIGVLVCRQFGIAPVSFDITLRDPLMIAFFTTIGFGASVALLKVGGPQVITFFLITTVMAVGQNILGILLTLPFKLPPLFGVLGGSVTLTGGPATGLAFAPLFEEAGVAGAATIAVVAPISNRMGPRTLPARRPRPGPASPVSGASSASSSATPPARTSSEMRAIDRKRLERIVKSLIF